MATTGDQAGNPAVIPLIINNEDVVTEIKFDVNNPVSGQRVHQSSGASVNDAKRAVDAAQAAFPAWKKTKPFARREILLKAADVMLARREELIRYQIEETGAQRLFAEVTTMIGVNFLKDFAARIPTIEGRAPELAEEGQSGIVYKEPYGVILGIAPWYVVHETPNDVILELPRALTAF